jgi:acetyl esterase/lipase
MSGLARPPRAVPAVTLAAWVAAATLFPASLLTVVPPGLNILWKLSIPVMELGHVFAVGTLILAAAAWRWGGGGRFRIPALLLLLASGLFLSPLARAVSTAARLERAYPAALAIPSWPSGAGLPARPLDWRHLWLGVRTPDIRPRTLAYASGDTALALDFYPAVRHGGGRAPCVLVIHGGGWDGGNRGQLPALNRYLAGKGYAVAALDYRLAPDHRSPAPVEDVAQALAWLRAHATALGIDPARFVLLGRSAGGQIALHAAYALRDEGVRGVVAFYAPADMLFGYSLPGNPLILDSRKVMDRYLGGGCLDVPDRCRAASPLEFAHADSPPTLLLHGRPDALVSFRHTRHLERRLAALGVPHFSVDLPWATHGYDYVFSGPGSQISLYFIMRFLERTTGAISPLPAGAGRAGAAFPTIPPRCASPCSPTSTPRTSMAARASMSST